MNILVAGGGYVGLSTATGFARQGHQVQLVEIDPHRTRLLAAGRVPFREPSLDSAFSHELADGRISVHPTYAQVSSPIDFAFICTSTPLMPDGLLDTTHVLEASEMTAAACHGPLRIVVRSTLNAGTTRMLEHKLGKDGRIQVLVNPEFLREGCGLYDFEAPSRIVIGGNDRAAVSALADLYSFTQAPILVMDPTTAELVKLGSNAALAVRVSMANEIAQVARSIGADVELLIQGIGADPRIGQDYLRPGIGFGGSCLPKDLTAFRAAANQMGFSSPVFDGASLTNDAVIGRLISRVRQDTHMPQPRVSVIGLAFKPGSDNLRNSQAARLPRTLLQHGNEVILFDPVAEANARQEFGNRVEYAASVQEAIEQADVVLVLDYTLWNGELVIDEDKVVLDSLGRRLCLVESGIPIVHGN